MTFRTWTSPSDVEHAIETETGRCVTCGNGPHCEPAPFDLGRDDETARYARRHHAAWESLTEEERRARYDEGVRLSGSATQHFGRDLLR